jgi:hypothetical protein
MMMMMMTFSIIDTFVAQNRLDESHKFVLLVIFYLNGSHKAFLRYLLRKRTCR